MLLEVVIEREGSMDLSAAHHLEAVAIHHAQLAPRRRQERIQGGLMNLGVQPLNLENGLDFTSENPNGFQSEATLSERDHLDEDVIGSQQLLIRGHESSPGGIRFLMPLIIGVQDGQ